MKKIIVLSLLFSFFFSCLSDGKKASVAEKVFEAKDHPSVQANIRFLEGTGDAYNAMNTIIIDSTLASLYLEKPSESIPLALEEFASQYEAFKKEFPESEQQWELNVETEIVFESETVLTYAINTYTYTGGAHGNDRVILLNFNATTGALLNNSELFTNMSEFTKVAKDWFIKTQKASNPDFSMEDFFFGEHFKLPENMGYSDDGFILLYNVYEIASYAQGYTEFAIPYDALKGLLKKAPY